MGLCISLSLKSPYYKINMDKITQHYTVPKIKNKLNFLENNKSYKLLGCNLSTKKTGQLMDLLRFIVKWWCNQNSNYPAPLTIN